jgi:hypothetical protein
MTTTPFWTNDPTILFNKNSLWQLWPTKSMTFEGKLNAISRSVILLTIVGFIFTHNWNLLIVGIITLAILFSLYQFRKQQLNRSKEGFVAVTTNDEDKNKNKNKNKNNGDDKMLQDPVTLTSVLRSEFHPTTKKNPFGNVLLTDIVDTPDRKAAAPSFNPDVYLEIDSSVKKQTQMLNPGIINTSKQIYGDLKDNYDLDNSMMRFYSTANSRVANDQGAFSQYLYGNMYSGKEDTPEGSMMRVKDNYRYILM